jgi:YHS domain-containing protein
MSKLQIGILAVAVLVALAATDIRVKRISPIGWGVYGPVHQVQGIAIQGYDCVAYHLANAAVKGKPEFSHSWKGATWHFESAKNKQLFEKSPEKYAPAFGGFCSYAASKGFTAKCDATAWRIEGGKLYFFNDAKMRDKWVAELEQGVIAKGEANWAKRPQKKLEN